MANAIEISDVSKRFRLYHEKYTSLKERVIHFGRIPFEEFWALRDLNIEIRQGETMGLLGHNGSGKSTLLKCIAGILQPTTGQIVTRGRLSALLELGAGFHPDLSGRENVFLNASILGMSKKEIAKRFDDIVAFAELEAFIDNQVKYYSSGMYVRLGFAVAVNMDPDILLVDEVLAVGDELFQRKCLDRVRQFQREGRTIVFVTHGADLTRQICDRVAVLDQGRMVALDRPGEAVRSFREHLLRRERFSEAEQLPIDSEHEPSEPASAGPAVVRTTDEPKLVQITSVTMEHPGSGERPYLEAGEPLDIKVAYESARIIDDAVFSIAVHNEDGALMYSSNTKLMEQPIGRIDGNGLVVFSIRPVPLLDGTYPVTVGVVSSDGGTVYDWHEQHYRFEVMNPGRATGMVNLPIEVSWFPEEARAENKSKIREA